ncbi:hypothetical protein Mapa_006734 [Marchantia paleacea]|nr:hypothetical protein Mapa_006734 [Marchantia paleacea]
MQSKGKDLLHACKEGHWETASMILKNKPDLTIIDTDGLNCLHYTAWRGHLDVLEMILSACAEIVNSKTKKGNTALMIACMSGQKAVVIMLLEHNPDLRIVNHRGLTCLHHAVSEGHLEVSHIVVKACPQIVNVKTKVGHTALMLACEKGFKEIVSMLLEYEADVMMVDDLKLNCLDYAEHEGHRDVLRMIIQACHRPEIMNSKTRMGETPLMWALRTGQAEIVRVLLENGENVTISNSSGWNGFHYAASRGLSNELKLCLEACAGVVNTKTKENQTALMLACKNGQKQIVSILLEHKADLMMIDDQGLSCLDHAARGSHSEVLKRVYQVCHMPEILNDRTQMSETPLMWALTNDQMEMANTLARHERNVLMSNNDGWNGLHYVTNRGLLSSLRFILRTYPEIVDTTTKAGKTALILAAEKASNGVEITNVLLEHNANVLVEDNDGWNCLHYAASRGLTGMMEKILESNTGHAEVLRLLLSEEGDEDYWNEEPVWLGDLEKKAARLKPESLQRASERLQLMEKKSTYEQLTALHMAAIGHHTAVVTFLERAYRSLALKHREFLLDPITMLLHFKAEKSLPQSTCDAFFWGLKPQPQIPALKTYFQDSRREFLQQINRTGSNFAGRVAKIDLEKTWGQYVSTDESVQSIQSNTTDLGGFFWCNLFNLSGMTDAYLAIIQYINAGDIIGRTALHYLAADCQCEPERLEDCITSFNSILGSLLYDVAAADSYGYIPLHLAARKGLSHLIECFLNMELNAEQKRFTYSAKGAMCVDGEEVLREAVRKSMGEDTAYDPNTGHVFKFLWNEERDGVIPLHYAIEKYFPVYDGIVQRLVEANIRDLLSRTGDGASAFTIALQMSLESPLYSIGQETSRTSKDNLLCPALVCGARAALSVTPTTFIAKEVRLIKNWLVTTSVLLMLSIVCILGAFAAAGMGASPLAVKYQTSLTFTSVVGGTACIVFLYYYFLRLNELKNWISLPKSMKRYYTKPSPNFTFSIWHGKLLEPSMHKDKSELYCLQSSSSKLSVKTAWDLMESKINIL